MGIQALIVSLYDVVKVNRKTKTVSAKVANRFNSFHIFRNNDFKRSEILCLVNQGMTKVTKGDRTF